MAACSAAQAALPVRCAGGAAAGRSDNRPDHPGKSGCSLLLLLLLLIPVAARSAAAAAAALLLPHRLIEGGCAVQVGAHCQDWPPGSREQCGLLLGRSMCRTSRCNNKFQFQCNLRLCSSWPPPWAAGPVQRGGAGGERGAERSRVCRRAAGAGLAGRRRARHGALTPVVAER